MRFFKTRHSSRGTSTAAAFILGLLRVALPLILIGGAAVYLISYHGKSTGALRISTSVPGADIYIAGVQTGFSTDTTLEQISVGTQIVTVRKQGFVSDPEVRIVSVAKGQLCSTSFVLKPITEVTQPDTFKPIRSVREQLLSTGIPVHSLPPVYGQRERLLNVLTDQQNVSRQPVVQSAPVQQDTFSSAPQVAAQQTSNNDTLAANGKLEGTQVLVSSIPDGATIVVNGSVTENTTPHTFHELDRGVYVFSLKKPGSISKPDSIVVTLTYNYQQELAAFELTTDQSLPQPTLEVSTKPPAAAFRIDGRLSGVGKGSVIAQYGAHKIEFADVPGYRTPDPVTVELTEEHPNEVLVGEYQRLEGNAYLAVVSGEDGQNIEGNKLRVYVDNELVLDGAKGKFDVALLGKILSGDRLVKIQYGELSEDINVNFQDGSVTEVSFRTESFFSKRSLKLRERTTMTESEWQKKSKRLTVLNLG